MRELKFRVWEMRHKDMFYSNEGLREFFRIFPGVCKSEIIMQYTGLKDKNGKEIYEGDIVNVPYNHIGKQVVKFIDGEFNIRHYKLSSCTILGNIYENPELLKED